SRILNCNEHSLVATVFGSHPQYTCPVRNRNHGLNSIHDQIQNDLPQLSAVSQDVWEDASKLSSTSHSAIFKLTLQKPHHLADQIVDIEPSPLLLALLQHSLDAPEDVSPALRVSDDPLQNGAHLLEVGRLIVEPAQARVGIGDDRCKRLSDFVCNGCCQLTH